MEDWQRNFYAYLAAHALRDHTATEMALMIRKALEIAEAHKYATAKSRFSFVIASANERDLREIRERLTPFENSIVELRSE
jgi:hypothetical protein